MAIVQALQGYDASNFKPDLDPNAVPHDFAFWQTTWGAGGLTINGIVNGVWPGADAKIQAEIRRGTPWGFMHFIRGEQSPEAEARFFVANNRSYFHHGIPAVDWEEADNAAYQDISWLDHWLAEVIRETGVPPVVYYSGKDAERVLDVCKAHDCAPWPAAYGSMDPTGYQVSPWGEGKYGGVIRQYSSKGRLQGYNGDLDLDKFYGTSEQLWKYAHLDGATPATQPTVIPASEHVDVNQMARDAVLGKYGVGETRRQALGASYDLVQSRINVLDGIANQVIQGAYGDGQQRKDALGKDYQAVQKLVDDKMAHGAQPKPRVWTIKPGDTLSSIAKQTGWGDNYQGLAAKNNISNTDLIQAGNTLYY